MSDSVASPKQLPPEEKEEAVPGLSAVTTSLCLFGEVFGVVLFFFPFGSLLAFPSIFLCVFLFLLCFLIYSKGSFSVLP